MNSAAAAPQFVHESEAQRQFARVRLPAKLLVSLDGNTGKFAIDDISAGGFSVQTGSESLRRGQLYNGRLVFRVDGFDLAMEVSFVPRVMDPERGRCGCEFQNLGSQEVSTLRYLITSFLSGELVSAGDVLNTLSRDNFTRARKGKGSQDLGFLGRIRATTASLMFMLVGMIAAGYVGYQLWQIYFVTHAESAMVASEQVPVSVPKDAKVTTLVKAGEPVKAGQAIATFDAPMLAYVNDLVGEGTYTVDQIEKLLGQRVRGTLTSPCDCKVMSLLPANEQYMSKGEQLAVLAPSDASAHVIARFSFDNADKLEEGQSVTLRLPGGETRSGTITSLYVDSERPNQPGNAISAQIESDKPLPMTAIGRPIGVTIDHIQSPALGSLTTQISGLF